MNRYDTAFSSLVTSLRRIAFLSTLIKYWPLISIKPGSSISLAAAAAATGKIISYIKQWYLKSFYSLKWGIRPATRIDGESENFEKPFNEPHHKKKDSFPFSFSSFSYPIHSHCSIFDLEQQTKTIPLK